MIVSYVVKFVVYYRWLIQFWMQVKKVELACSLIQYTRENIIYSNWHKELYSFIMAVQCTQ